MNNSDGDSEHWRPISCEDPGLVADARLNLHWALQIVAWFGNTYLDALPDDSHTNTTWLQDSQSLAGHVSPQGFRAALRLVDPALLLLDAAGTVRAERSIAGASLDQLEGWLSDTLTGLGVQAQPLVRREYEMPAHPVSQGGTFLTGSEKGNQTLRHLFANAHRSLTAFSRDAGEASPVRCWPHHFDMATLFTLDPAANSKPGRFVGLGLSPGDTSYDEPYFYVNLWPAPADTACLPELAEGTWHTRGFVAAVLTMSQLTQESAAQGSQLERFLRTSFAACRRVLGVGDA